MKEQPLFFTAKTIKPKDRSQIVSIKTGLRELDNKIIGLNKQETSCVSGLRGSAKSTWLSNLAIEVVHGGNKVALFSGELSENRVLEWLQLQSAGKKNTHPTKYENYFYVDDKTKEKINTWLDQKLFVYNNKYGRKAGEVLKSIEDCIKNKHVDLVILDNLMSIDLDSNNYNKNEKQTSFIQSVSSFAIENDVHIILVAHPRKAIGFLRMDDIAGTADLTNAVDNVFIIHRVNNDFKRLSKLMFGWKQDHDIYSFDNVIEICKNRDLGYQDELIGLYYEKESKRFSCDRENTKMYGWEYDGIEMDESAQLPFDPFGL